MSNSHTPRFLVSTALTAAVLALLSACGGADGPATGPSATQKLDAQTANFLGQIAKADADRPVRALATAQDVNAKAVIDWAEYKFPDLFKGAITSLDAVEFDGKIFYARIYNGPAGLRYLGVTTDGRIFGLGDFTNNQLQQFDTVAFWTPQILADWSKFQPGGDGNNTPPGALNGCSITGAEYLQTGKRYRANYIDTINTVQVGQYAIEQVVDGASTFEGQSVVKTTTKITGTYADLGPNTLDSTTILYERSRADGFHETLGGETTQSISGFTTTVKVKYAPPDINSEFGLSQGQSFVKATTSIVTTNGLPGLPTSTITSTDSTTWTYEGRETITVRGKTYSTCRYRSVVAGSESLPVSKHWFIVNRGIPAREETSQASATGGVTTTVSELESATINGAPI